MSQRITKHGLENEPVRSPECTLVTALCEYDQSGLVNRQQPHCRPSGNFFKALRPMMATQRVFDKEANMQRALVPSYFPANSEDWERLVQAATQTGILAILNPDSGPGKAPDPAFQAVAAKCSHGGVGMLGYVHTQYGRRPLVDVVAEIDRFYQWYQVTGIFFDEVSTSEDTLVYYSTLHQYVKGKKAATTVNSTGSACEPPHKTSPSSGTGREPWVVINPGTSIPPAFLEVCDIAVTFENHCSEYAEWRPKSWEKGVPACRFAHLVYGVTNDPDMLRILARSQKNRAGHVYISSLALPNPWLALPGPGAWERQVEVMQACDMARSAGQRSFFRKIAAWLKG